MSSSLCDYNFTRRDASLYSVPPHSLFDRDLFPNIRIDRPAGLDACSSGRQALDKFYQLPTDGPPAYDTRMPDSVLWNMVEGPLHFRHHPSTKANDLLDNHHVYSEVQGQAIKGDWMLNETPPRFQARTAAVFFVNLPARPQLQTSSPHGLSCKLTSYRSTRGIPPTG